MPNWPNGMERESHIKVLLWKTWSLSLNQILWRRMTGVFPASGNEETQTHSLKLPTCNISFDLDGCLPFFLFLRPPLGLAHHGGGVGASSGLGDRAKRALEGRWPAWGGPWVGSVSVAGEGAVLWQPCVVSLSIQDKPPTQDSIWQMRKKWNKVCSLFFFFSSRNGPREPRLGLTLGLFPF